MGPGGNRAARQESEARGLGLGTEVLRPGPSLVWGQGPGSGRREPRFRLMIDSEPGVRVPDLEICD